MNRKEEFEKRKKISQSAIESAFDSDEGESDVDLFISHHLEEINTEYWQCEIGSKKPTNRQVLGILRYQSNFNDDEEFDLETFDFTLPSGITDYVLSVSFDENGKIATIAMES